jgi:hypothetical protein
MRPHAIHGHFGFVASIVLLSALASACSGGSAIDGKYYNSTSGEFAMELAGGKVVSMQGQGAQSMTYEVRRDSLVIHDPRHGMADEMTFGIERDGSLSLGPLGSLTKTRK